MSINMVILIKRLVLTMPFYRNFLGVTQRTVMFTRWLVRRTSAYVHFSGCIDCYDPFLITFCREAFEIDITWNNLRSMFVWNFFVIFQRITDISFFPDNRRSYTLISESCIFPISGINWNSFFIVSSSKLDEFNKFKLGKYEVYSVHLMALVLCERIVLSLNIWNC